MNHGRVLQGMAKEDWRRDAGDGVRDNIIMDWESWNQ